MGARGLIRETVGPFASVVVDERGGLHGLSCGVQRSRSRWQARIQRVVLRMIRDGPAELWRV